MGIYEEYHSGKDCVGKIVLKVLRFKNFAEKFDILPLNVEIIRPFKFRKSHPKKLILCAYRYSKLKFC